MSEFSFKTKGVTNDGEILISAQEVQELLHDIHTEHLAALQSEKIQAVRNVRKCERISYQSVTLTFSSCRAASEFERHIEQLKEQGEC